MGTGASFPGLKQPRCEADNSPPSTTVTEKAWSYISTPPTRLHGVVRNEAQSQLYWLINFTHLLLITGTPQNNYQETFHIHA
jgi:hypothetical protein